MAVMAALPIMAALAFAFHVPAHSAVDIRLRMCAADSGSAADIRKASSVDVSPAAIEARRHLRAAEAQQKEAMLDCLLQPGGDEGYLATRKHLVGLGPGKLNSSQLLTTDEQAGFYPELLDCDRNRQQMAFIDELRCVGCTFCAAIARQTFVMDDEFGTARVVQQGGDVVDAIDEAIESCPADCIHWTTRNEIEVLEEHREIHLSRLLGSGLTTGHWRDPLEQDGWRTAWHDGWDDSRHTREDGQQRDDVPR